MEGSGRPEAQPMLSRMRRRLMLTPDHAQPPHPPLPLQYHTSPVTGLCFAPRSMLLATAARDGTLALWPLYQPEERG